MAANEVISSKRPAAKRATSQRRRLVPLAEDPSTQAFIGEVAGDESAAPKRVRRTITVQKMDLNYFTKLNVLEQIEVVKKGVDAKVIMRLADTMSSTSDRLITMLGFPRSTVARKFKEHALLSSEQSERVLGVMKLVNQVKEMVEQSGGTKNFNAAHWVRQWLEQPNPALDGRMPSEFMDTNMGQELVSKVVAKMQSGVYS